MMWAESGEEEKEPELHMSSSGEQRKHMTSIFCICKNQTLFNNSSAPATFAERRSHLVIQSQCPFGSPIALMARVTRERVELLLTGVRFSVPGTQTPLRNQCRVLPREHLL